MLERLRVHMAERCLARNVYSAMMPVLLVEKALGGACIFLDIETYCRLFIVDLSPITTVDEFLYGMTTVG